MKELTSGFRRLFGVAGVVVVLSVSLAGCRSNPADPPPLAPDTATGGRTGSGGRGGAGSGKGGSGSGSGGAAMAGATGTPDATSDAVTDASSDAVSDGPASDRPGDVAVDHVAPPPDAKLDVQPPRDMAPDLARNLPVGRECVQNNQCTSGFCVDGVCCSSSCTDSCQACAMARTGQMNGKCAPATEMVGKACGKGCQQFPGQMLLAVVDKVCSSAGQCAFPAIPQGIEYCADTDPCTTNTCDQPTPTTARCVKVPKCGGTTCCCVTGATSSCTAKTACTGAGKACM